MARCLMMRGMLISRLLGETHIRTWRFLDRLLVTPIFIPRGVHDGKGCYIASMMLGWLSSSSSTPVFTVHIVAQQRGYTQLVYAL